MKGMVIDMLYIVEPRKEDGVIDAKDPQGCFGIFDARGVSGDYITNYFFKHFPEKDSVGWNEIHDWFKTKGWYIRRKTW